MGKIDDDITRWSNAKKARMFAHIIAHLTIQRGGEAKIPLEELRDMQFPIGFAVEDGKVVIAIGETSGPSKWGDFIKNAITPDGLVGYDEQGQLRMARLVDDGESYEIRPTVDLRSKRCAICLHAWGATSESWHDQFRLNLGYGSMWGDHEDPSVGDLVHLTCWLRTRALDERMTYEGWVARARVRYQLSLLQNGYWPEKDPWAGKPWYRFRLLDHDAHFDIGRRKRVVSISVMPTDEATLDWHEQAKEAFADEDVTKEFGPGRVLLHAWTDEKGAEYVRKLVNIAGYGHVEKPAEPKAEEEGA